MFSQIGIHIGSFTIHWYGLLYIAGGVFCFLYINTVLKGRMPKNADLWDMLGIVFAGIILGGRLGYVLFYNTGYYLSNPLKVLALMEGGMSFFGALVGVVIGILIYAKKKHISWATLTDIIVVPLPVALGLGRLGNFLNGELYGKATDLPWCMYFANGGNICRHPSQLYAILLEGIILFVIMLIASRKERRAGVLSGVFGIGYGVARIITESTRELEPNTPTFLGMITISHVFSVILIAAGIYLVTRRGRPSVSSPAIH